MSLMLKTLVAVAVGAGLYAATQHLREAPPVTVAAGPSPLSGPMAPIPGLDPNPHPMSEDLHPLDRTPRARPLDLGNANARAAASELHRLDDQGVSGSWAFPRNQRP